MLSPKSGSLPVICVIVNALLSHVAVSHYHDNGYQCVKNFSLYVFMTSGFEISCQLEHIKSCNHILQL